MSLEQAMSAAQSALDFHDMDPSPRHGEAALAGALRRLLEACQQEGS